MTTIERTHPGQLARYGCQVETAAPLDAHQADRAGLLDCIVAKPFAPTEVLDEMARSLSATSV